MRRDGKIRLAVFKLSSCSGCQQQLIDLGEDLLALAEEVEIAHFLEASSKTDPGPYDVALIEGSISTPREVEVVKEAREKSRVVVAFGSCAIYGGVQALRNWMRFDDVKRQVYPKPELVEALEKTFPISDYIQVDYVISGCPPGKYQVLSILKQILIGKRAYHREESLCQECKRKGNICIVVARGIPCLGPVVREGCGALCPSYSRGCYGCFGPMIDPKPEALSRMFEEMGLPRAEVILKIKSSITSWSEPFRRFVKRYEQQEL